MIKVIIKDKQTGLQKEVQMTRTLNGDYVLMEHPDIDVVVIPSKNKVLALPKDEQSDRVYYLKDKLFKYMNQKGVIMPDSVNGGNIFGSLQASYIPEPPGGENPLQVVVYTIANFIEDERPVYTYEKDFQDAMENDLLNPPIQDSTELGEVPQEPFKGSIPKYGFPTRGIYRYNY
jgi:hypothetical protein